MLIARTGTFSAHATGYPTGVPTLSSAVLTQDLENSRVQATLTLAAEPPAGSEATIVFADVVNGVCDLDNGDRFAIDVTATTASLDTFVGHASYYSWECGAVFVFPNGTDPATDAMSGPLTEVYRAVEKSITIDGATILGSPKLELVRGEWTEISVGLLNTSAIPLDDIVVGGSGQGLKVRGGSTGYVSEDADAETSIRVKLVAPKKRTTLALTAKGEGVEATRAFAVRQVPPPAPPAPGRYRSADGDVKFTVRGRTIVSFWGDVAVDCGIGPLRTAYSFKKVRVPRNGLISESQKVDEHTYGLSMKVAGSRVTRGTFSIYLPPPPGTTLSCSGAVYFKATRRK